MATATIRQFEQDGRSLASPRVAPWYEGLLWSGINLRGWVRLLVRNRCRVDWRRTPAVLCITAYSVANSLLGLLERAIYGRRIARVEVDPEPVIILGHWRTGTTLLHELLAQDPRLTFPTTYQCFAPNHFLISRRFVGRFLSFLLPRERPMDPMPMGLDRPQEDESALCNLGLPSPFLQVAFPNRPPHDPQYVDMEGLSPAAARRWTNTWLRFLRRVTLRRPGTLVLKSPQHTFRLPLLLAMFPRARIVYMVRDPAVVFPSTVHFWKSMYLGHGLQRPTFAGLDEQVYSTFLRMHERIEATRCLAPPERFYTLRYEDLVAHPDEELRRLYERLGLGDFAPAEAGVRRYLAETHAYRANRYRDDPQRDGEVRRRWSAYAVQHGYATGA